MLFFIPSPALIEVVAVRSIHRLDA